MTLKSLRRVAAASTLAVSASCLMTAAAPAAPATAGWEALPAETVLCFRMPNTQGFIEDFRANTLAGQRIFTEDRWNQVMDIIQSQNQADWDEMVTTLEEYGFTMDDLFEIVQNNWGAAFIADPQGDGELPRMIMLGWADLPDEDIDRIYAAIDRANEENPTEEMRRVDLDLAGATVRQYSIPEYGMDREANWDLPDGFENMTEAEMDAHWAEVEEINAAAEYTKVDETHLLLTRVPGRMIVTVGIPQNKEAVREMIAAEQDIDWESATDAASVQAVLARYLAAQDGGADDAFAAKMLAEPEAAAMVGRDRALFEFYADGARALELIYFGIRAENGEEDARQFETAMHSLGLNKLGVTAGSAYMDDGSIKYGMFSQIAVPRSGLPGTLDGQTLPAAPPAWVPAGVSYFHLAYDLSKLYDVVVQTVQDMAGPEAAQQVQMGNMMVQGYAQADIPTILRALGIRHSLILLEAREFTQEVEEWDYDTEEFKTVQRTSYVRPGAVVWDLADAEVWTRVMGALKNFAGMAGPDGGVALVDEQGFTGMRFDDGPFPGALMLGQGKLVLSFGPDVTARTLSLINNPPAGGNALATSADFAEGGTLIDYRDNIMFALQNGGEDLVNTKQQAVAALEGDDSGLEPELVQMILDILPTDEDLRASFGVTVGQMYMTDNGLIYEAASATPAAE